MPLAPISAVTEAELPGIIEALRRRLGRRVPRRRAAELWSAAQILMGLRYPQPLIDQLLHGVLAMKESVTYQAILEEGAAKGEARGRVAEAKRILQLQGSRRFGPPAARATAALDRVNDLGQLEALAERLLQVSGWEELLNLPAPRSRGRRSTP